MYNDEFVKKLNSAWVVKIQKRRQYSTILRIFVRKVRQDFQHFYSESETESAHADFTKT